MSGLPVHNQRMQARRLLRQLRLANAAVITLIEELIQDGSHFPTAFEWNAWEADIEDAIGWLTMAKDLIKNTKTELESK